MLRKCKAGAGAKARPAFFHGWFQFGNAEGGMDGMAVVEYEDGTTDYFSPGYIVFDTPQPQTLWKAQIYSTQLAKERHARCSTIASNRLKGLGVVTGQRSALSNSTAPVCRDVVVN